MTKKKYYNRTNTCDKCREKGIETKLVQHTNALRERNKEGNWTGRWSCKSCWDKDYQKNDPNSTNNIIKSMRDHRTGNLDPNSNYAKGDNFEDLTSRWLGVKRLSVEYDKYSMLPLDHSPIPNGVSVKIGDKLVDLSGKIPQTKGKWYDSCNRCWSQNVENECGKEFDYLIFYCVSKDGKIIERIYIFPWIEIVSSSSIGIYKNPLASRGPFWYEEYIIKDENIIRKVNDIWKEIIGE